MITKPEEHETNRTGKRLLRDVLEPLGWVVNDVQEDYGIDCNVQVFDANSPTGVWFHAQLKSSASSDYATDRTFVSQDLSIDHARHYALEMRQPVLLLHADVIAKTVYWYAPQLDRQLTKVVGQSAAKSITVRVPTCQQLPVSAPDLLTSLENIYLVLANRQLTTSSSRSFAESLTHLPDQEALHRAFQEKNDTLKLGKIRALFEQKRYDEARPRTEAVLTDPDSTVEIKFWAQIQLEAIECTQIHHSGEPQNELPKVLLAHAKSLQKLTASGPKHLKFYSLVARHAAEMELLAHESFSLFMALQQHLEHGNPMMALGLYARRSEVTRGVVSKYNRCARLAQSAVNYPDRWALGRALVRIVRAIGRYLVTLRLENNLEVTEALMQSALQICKLAAWICKETGDPEGIGLAIVSVLLTTSSTDSNSYRWACEAAHNLVDAEIRADIFRKIERATRRWSGEPVEGDYKGDTTWQVIQNMATALGIDIRDDSDPLVGGLRIAAKDDSPERVLAKCEHLLVGQGAMGPVACRIQSLFNITTAGSKVVHCTLHDFHVEGKELDGAFGAFKQAHCNSCADQKPRPSGWQYTEEEMRTSQARHRGFVARLAGTPNGLRYTNED